MPIANSGLSAWGLSLTLALVCFHSEVSAQCNFNLRFDDDTYIKYCRNRSASEVNANVTRAVVVIHGSGSDAPLYYNYVVTAANREGINLAKTTIIAPQFLEGAQNNTADLLFWTGGWRFCNTGSYWDGNSTEHGLSSCGVLDELIERLVDNNANLEHIAFIGHSAGAQMLQRYAPRSSGYEYAQQAGVDVSFGYSGAGRFAWINNNRDGFNPKCAGYNNYPLGLDNRNGYMNDISVAQHRLNEMTRLIYRAVGEDDTRDALSNPTTCPATPTIDDLTALQGADRRDRLNNFMEELGEQCLVTYGWLCQYAQFASVRASTIIPRLSHSSEDLFKERWAESVMFYWPDQPHPDD